MKRLLITTAALALVAQLAAAQAVYSSNVVGYTKLDLKAGANLLGSSWLAVGGDGAAATLQEMLDASELTSYSADGLIAGDEIRTWNLAAGDWGPGYFYVDQPGIGENFANAWLDEGFNTQTPELGSGNGFWLILKEAASVTLQGEVGIDPVTLTLKEGANLVANPFPATRSWNAGGITGTGLTSYSEDGLVAGDEVRTWNLASGDWGPGYFYVDQPGIGENYADTWMDEGFNPLDLELDSNEGFWYIAADSGAELIFASPLAD